MFLISEGQSWHQGTMAELRGAWNIGYAIGATPNCSNQSADLSRLIMSMIERDVVALRATDCFELETKLNLHGDVMTLNGIATQPLLVSGLADLRRSNSLRRAA